MRYTYDLDRLIKNGRTGAHGFLDRREAEVMMVNGDIARHPDEPSVLRRRPDGKVLAIYLPSFGLISSRPMPCELIPGAAA